MIESGDVAETHSTARRFRGIAFYLGAAATAVFMVRLLGVSWSTHFPATWPDAVYPREGYLAVAAKSPFRPSFYFAFRPIGYPFLLWLLGRSSHLVVIAQTSIYCASVITLCATALRVMRSRVVGIATVLLVVGIALQAKYAMWNTQILSESLAISLGFFTLAAWWRFAIAPTRRRAALGLLCVIAFVVTRDAHVLPVTMVMVPVALAIARWGKGLGSDVRRTLTAGALVVVIVAGYSYLATNASHRAVLSFHNAIGVRILPDPQLSKWFDAHGMPLGDALRSRTGKSGLDDTFYASHDPKFATYRHWARGGGPRELVLSLVVLAPHYAHLMYDDLPTLLKGDVRYYDTQSAYQRLPDRVPLQLGGPTTRRGLTFWLVLSVLAFGALIGFGIRDRRRIRTAVFGATALLLTIVELYLTWGGDPVEMQRHVIGALSRLSVILVIVVASGVDAALAEPPTRLTTPVDVPAGVAADA